MHLYSISLLFPTLSLHFFLDTFDFFLEIILERSEKLSESIGRQIIQAALFGQRFGAIEGCNAQLSGATHHVALRHSLHQLLVVGQIAQKYAQHHDDDN